MILTIPKIHTSSLYLCLIKDQTKTRNGKIMWQKCACKAIVAKRESLPTVEENC